MLRWAMGRIERLRLGAARIRTLSRRTGEPAHRIAVRVSRLRSREGYGLDEIDLLGLTGSGSAHRRIASKRRGRAARDLLNPDWMRPLADNKALFALHCESSGLPVPRTLAVYSGQRTGWQPPKQLVRSPSEWHRILIDELPDEFVVKPCVGGYGRGVRLIRRHGGEFSTSGGPIGSTKALLELLDSESTATPWIIQERIRSHAGIAALTGTDRLQTMRLTTLLREDRVEILFGFMKFIAGGADSDNFDGGRSGNIIGSVEPATGIVTEALGKGATGVSAHPRTGQPLIGFEIPCYPAAVELVRRAAWCFAPARTLGWDVALTRRGPVLLETNWDWAQIMALPDVPEAMLKLVEATHGRG